MEVRNDDDAHTYHQEQQSSPTPSKQVKASPNSVDKNSVTQRSNSWFLSAIFNRIYRLLFLLPVPRKLIELYAFLMYFQVAEGADGSHGMCQSNLYKAQLSALGFNFIMCCSPFFG